MNGDHDRDDALPDKHGEIVDAICHMAGIEERLTPRSPVLSKKEALQVGRFLSVLLQLRKGGTHADCECKCDRAR